jgi:hypothetical protein
MPVFRDVAGDVGQLHAHAERRGVGEKAAIREAEDRTQEHADSPSDPKAVPQEVGLEQTGRCCEVRPHPIEQGQGRLEWQVVPADDIRQPAALGGDRAFSAGDPADVLRGLFDELHRLLRRGGSIDAVVAPPTPGVETLDVGPFAGG